MNTSENVHDQTEIYVPSMLFLRIIKKCLLLWCLVPDGNNFVVKSLFLIYILIQLSITLISLTWAN